MLYSDSGVLQALAVTEAPQSALMHQGWRRDSQGRAYVALHPAPIGYRHWGRSFTPGGALRVNTGNTAPGDEWIDGLRYDISGAIYANQISIDSSTGISFNLPLNDLGAGAVNIVPTVGTAGTFTRASVAWTKLSTGLWAQVASGQARSCYLGLNTAASTYGGYLSEPARTQLVTPTASIRDMTNAAWIKVTMTTAFTSTGIGGASNSCTRCTATGATSTILQTLVAAASSRTYSCWIKRVTGTGVINIVQGATVLDVTALINSSTFTLVQLNASVLNSAFGIQIITSGDAIDVDFNQFEAGAQATTPIDNTGTRLRDILSFPQLGSALDADGSCYAEVSAMCPTSAFTGIFVTIQDTSGICLSTPVGAWTINNAFDGTNTPSKTGLTDISTVVGKRASSWGPAGMSSTGDGLAPAVTAFDGKMGADASTTIGIGCSAAGAGTNHVCGMAKNVKIWTVQLSDVQLQTLTA